MKKRNFVSYLLVIFLLGFINLCGCKKDKTEDPVTPPETTVTDADGNVYDIIELYSQKWMKQNLRTTKYRNGDSIPYKSNNSAWASLNSGGWCYYDNDVANNAIYGKLYNYFAVADSRNLAPTGWHVAKLEDWNTLITNLGGTVVASGKLKESGTAHWTAPNTGATNSSGFTALPGGERFGTSDGSFYQKGSEAFFWTSTTDGSDAKNIYLTFMNAEVYIYSNPMKFGYSVRCVKD